MAETSREGRLRILIERGWSVRAIAGVLGVPTSTAQDAVASVRHQYGLPARNMGGRPRILSTQDVRQLSRMIVRGSFRTWRAVADAFFDNCNIRLSASTVRRYCGEIGLRSRALLRSPPLTKATMSKRLAWAKRHLAWGDKEWGQVVWSDESAFRLYRIDGRARIIRQDGAQPRPQDYQIRAHTGGGCIHVWGCMTSHGVGVLIRLEGTINAANYIEQVVTSALPESLARLRLRRDRVLFMQDNAAAHKANTTKTALKDAGIKILDWPAFSPDLNPIENLWDFLKWEVGKMPQAHSLNELWAQVHTAWHNITPDLCESLVDSLPRRLAAVKKAKGGATKY
jgi:transposase